MFLRAGTVPPGTGTAAACRGTGRTEEGGNITQEFLYKAGSREGPAEEGTLYAESREEAGLTLLKQYERIYRLETVRRFFPARRRKLNDFDRETFFHQMGLLLKSRIPILRVLQLMGSGHAAGTALLCRSMAAELARGMALSQSFARHREEVGDLACSLAAAGEKSGQVGTVLEALADSYRQRRKVRRNLISACLYPALLLVLGTGVSLCFVQGILPVFADLYGTLKMPVPLAMRMLLQAAAWARQAPAAFGMLLALPVVFAGILLRTRGLRVFCLGPLRRLYGAYWEIRFTSLLALLLRSGLTVDEALAEAGKILPEGRFRQAGSRLSQAVFKGESLARAAQQNPVLCSRLTAEFIAIGEASGQLASMLHEVSQLHRQEFQDGLKRIRTFLEPALLLLLAGLCTIMVYLVLSPMLHLMDGLPVAI